MRVRIQSDGYALSTKITDADTGQDLAGILRVNKIEITASNPIEVTMTAISPKIDIIGEATIFCPHCQYAFSGKDEKEK